MMNKSNASLSHMSNLVQAIVLSTFYSSKLIQLFFLQASHAGVFLSVCRLLQPYTLPLPIMKGSCKNEEVHGCLHAFNPELECTLKRVHPDCLSYALNSAEMCSGHFYKGTCEVHVQKLSWIQQTVVWWLGSAGAAGFWGSRTPVPYYQ